ncbi:MAG TPA: YceD family protein [Chthonomonadaceae bacterium]|nr:YceD family protein [Chthonomonadaceae bacterium]
MRLDLTELLHEVGKQVEYDIQEPPLVDEDVECTQPIQGRAVFTNTGGLLLIRGNARTAVALSCSRCALYYEQPITFSIEEQFEIRRESGPRGSTAITLLDEDASPIAGKLFEGYVLDLTEMLRQYILLAEPTRPLPPLDAGGRCAHCHRTPEEVLREATGEAAAEEAPINPAFARLGELLDRNDSI